MHRMEKSNRSFAGKLTRPSLAIAAFVLSACAGAPQVDVQRESPSARGTAADTPVAFQQLDTMQYHAFVANWDDAKHPVNCAVMRSTSDWKAIMHPAPVMSNQAQQFAPPDSFFETRQILMAARVTPAPIGDVRPFSISQVTRQGGNIVVDYGYQVPAPAGSSQIKTYFLVTIPKVTPAIAEVRFVENGRSVCSVPLD
ncbi:hypothetical protein [Paraburkholderia sp.]|jgi:hypothetical protein|uniref:hypothetical protein n=1 Tax=Paraburkholderia sp. TaxID=1926495 RepID=UPI0010DCBBE8|nr:hypothetical protein [Paraburkholderia sp.]